MSHPLLPEISSFLPPSYFFLEVSNNIEPTGEAGGQQKWTAQRDFKTQIICVTTHPEGEQHTFWPLTP